MPLFKIKTHSLKDYSIGTEKFSNTAVIAFAQTLTPKVRLANVANSAFAISGDTAVNIGGGFIVLTGTDFQSGAQVLVGNTPATSTAFVNSSILQVQVPDRPAGTYNLFVVNPDGGTGIRVNGLTYSAFPAFSTGATLTSQTSGSAFGLSISATSDSNVTYSNTSTLPAGTILLSNGWFYGSNSVATDTTYSFTVKATDAENQDTDRTFSLSITIPFKLWMWGRNHQGQLGLNNTVTRSSPVQVGSDTDWNQISTGFVTSAATKQNGTLWTWGGNTNGQLGQGDTVARSVPAQIGASTNWNRVSAGQTNVLATKTDGTLWTWGQGTFGAHGLNQSTPYARSNPIQIGTDTNWNLIDTVQYTRMAIKTNGTLWSWGMNANGQLGHNDRVYKSSPTQIGTGTNWSLVSTWNYNTFAIKTDGTLWSWGLNSNGSLGFNDRVSRSSPTQVGSSTDWSRVSGGGQVSMAIKTDGTLWLWGRNAYGTLGQNDQINRSSPTQLGATTNWSEISARNGGAVMATKTDGTLWLWGGNNYGVLGLGNTIHRSSPVQLGTRTAWTLVSSGGYASMAINRS